MNRIDYDKLQGINHYLDRYNHFGLDWNRLGESVRSALLGFQDTAWSEAMRQNTLGIKEGNRLGESVRSALLGFQDTAWSEAMRQNTLGIKEGNRLGESVRSALLGFQDTAWSEAMRQNLLGINKGHLLGGSPSIALSGFRNSVAMDFMNQNAFAIKDMKWLGESTRFALSGLQDSEAIRAIRDLSNSPFNSFLTDVVFNELDLIEIDNVDDGDGDCSVDEDIQIEIQRELEGDCDYSLLSEKAQSFLLCLYEDYFRPIFLGCVASIIMTNAEKVQISLANKQTSGQILSCVRKLDPKVNYYLLKGYRVVIGSEVNLRKSPSMKSGSYHYLTSWQAN